MNTLQMVHNAPYGQSFPLPSDMKSKHGRLMLWPLEKPWRFLQVLMDEFIPLKCLFWESPTQTVSYCLPDVLGLEHWSMTCSKFHKVRN